VRRRRAAVERCGSWSRDLHPGYAGDPPSTSSSTKAIGMKIFLTALRLHWQPARAPTGSYSRVPK